MNNSNYKILDLFNNEKYSQLAFDNKANYQKNSPYPHIVFDDFLPIEIAKTISDEYPNLANGDKDFRFHDHEYASRYFLEDSRRFSSNLKLFSHALSSRSFLLFLET